MCDIQQIWFQIERTSSSLQYVKCGPGHIQCIYSSAYPDFSIQLNVSALLMEISRKFNVRYTANLVPNTAHILQLSLCEPWSRTCTKYLQLRKFGLHYSTKGICADIGDISTIQCASYCKRDAKYRAYPPVYAIWTLLPAIYCVVTGANIQAPIFKWTYLCRYWRYVDKLMIKYCKDADRHVGKRI
jgi:hypothetical protein